MGAAASAFAADGFRASSIKSIAHSAGVNEVTVYRYFPKKELMYWEAIDSRLRSAGIMEFMAGASPFPSDPRGIMRELGGRVIDMANRDPGLIRLLYFTVLELERETALAFKIHLRPVIEALKASVNSRKGGAIRAQEIEFVVTAFVGMIFAHSSLYGMLGKNPQDCGQVDELAAKYASLCITGLNLGSEL